jgi:hypothetical protein
MSSEDRITPLENAFSTLAELAADHQRRISRLEESFVMLVDLTRNQDAGMDDLRAAQAEAERKIAALADANLRTEESQAHMAEAFGRLAEALRHLAEAQAHSDQRLDALIDIVHGWRNGQPPSL